MLSFQSQLPQQAVNPINDIVHSVKTGESNSIKQSLEFFKKDRKNTRQISNVVLYKQYQQCIVESGMLHKNISSSHFHIFMRETISGWRIKGNWNICFYSISTDIAIIFSGQNQYASEQCWVGCFSVLLETIENVPKAAGLALERHQFIHCLKHYTRLSATSRGA